MFLINMGVPGAQGATAGGLVGPKGKKGGSPPDSVDQLFGLCAPFRPPVYIPQECVGMEILPYWGKNRHVLDRREVTNLAAGGSVAGDIRVTTDVDTKKGVCC